jgi:hypothetical protein
MDQRPTGEFPPVQEQPNAPPPYAAVDDKQPSRALFPNSQIHSSAAVWDTRFAHVVKMEIGNVPIAIAYAAAVMEVVVIAHV